MDHPLRDFLRDRFEPEGRYGLRLTLLAVAFLLVALPFSFLLVQVVREGGLLSLDTAAANHLHEYVRGRDWLVTLLQVISFLGGPPWLWLIVGSSVIFTWVRGRRRLAVFLAATCLLGSFLDTAVKILVDRPRPSLSDPVATAHGKSFPSGHSMSSLVAYGSLLLVFFPVVPRSKRVPLALGAALLVLAIGFTRLALGVHYITDVLGGFVLGAAWLAASAAVFRVWRRESGREPVSPLRGLEPEAKKDLVKGT